MTSVYPDADLASLVISNKGSEIRFPGCQKFSALIVQDTIESKVLHLLHGQRAGPYAGSLTAGSADKIPRHTDGVRSRR